MLITNIANVARATVARVLRATERLHPNRLQKSLRERPHAAHIAAHAAAHLLDEVQASPAVWDDLAGALDAVSEDAARLLRQHKDDRWTPESRSDDHLAHCAADCAMALTYREEPGWAEAREKSLYTPVDKDAATD